MGVSSVIEVVTPAPSQDLLTLEEFKADHGITGTDRDALYQRAISRTSRSIANACNRVLVAERVRQTWWIGQEGLTSPLYDSLPVLQLGRFPAGTVHEVKELGTVLETGLYRLAPEEGQLFRQDADGRQICWDCAKITVEYTGGFVEIPDDLVFAASTIAWNRFQSRNKDRDIKSKFVDGVDRVEFFEQSGGFGAEIDEIIEFYRVRGFR